MLNFSELYHIELLYKDYYDDIYGYILMINYNHSETEDIVQNTFIKAMKSLNQFRGDSNIKTWLFTIARNECIRYPKSKALLLNEQVITTVHSLCIEDNYCNKEMTTYILNYISTCDEPIKSLFALRLQGRTFVEIGKILEKSDVWCRVTYMRRKNELLTKLEILFDYPNTNSY